MEKKKQERMIVVPYRPGEKLKRHIMAWVAVTLGIMGGIALGWIAGDRHSDAVEEENSKLVALLTTAEDRSTELSRQVATLERGRKIDQVANRDVQDSVQKLEGKVRQLEEDIAFYKSIMAPSENNKGLQIQSLELSPAREPRRFEYKLVLTQVANNKSYISGVVAVNLIGSKDGKQEILALRDVAGIEELGVKFRFRYFQNIEGEMTLPEEFTPQKIQVVAQASGKKATKMERTFDWQES